MRLERVIIFMCLGKLILTRVKKALPQVYRSGKQCWQRKLWPAQWPSGDFGSGELSLSVQRAPGTKLS